jgi:hypothetical protein
MGILGQLVFYTETPTQEPRRQAEQVYRLFFSDAPIRLATRYVDNSWEYLQRIISGNSSDADADEDIIYEEDITDPSSIQEALKLYRDGSALLLMLVGRSKLFERMVEITSAIPESIRGYFVPSSPWINIGYHDIFDAFESEQGHLYGRAFFSIKFDCPGMPHNPKEYRRLLFEIPEIDEIRKGFESIVGPLEQCVYWDG